MKILLLLCPISTDNWVSANFFQLNLYLNIIKITSTGNNNFHRFICRFFVSFLNFFLLG